MNQNPNDRLTTEELREEALALAAKSSSAGDASAPSPPVDLEPTTDDLDGTDPTTEDEESEVIDSTTEDEESELIDSATEDENSEVIEAVSEDESGEGTELAGSTSVETPSGDTTEQIDHISTSVDIDEVATSPDDDAPTEHQEAEAREEIDDADAEAPKDAANDRSGLSDKRVAIAIAAITVVGFALRIAGVGDRPLHHDESLDAWWSWKVLENTFGGYDPVYHGPLRFYITAGFYWFFGESVAVARLFSVITGTLLIATPYFLRRQIGRVGAIAAAVFFCISPSLLYYSRFGREDIQVVFFTAVMLVGTVAYFRKPNAWLPSVVAGALACSLAIKESTYLLIYVVVAFFFIALAVEFSRLTASDDDDRFDTLIPFVAVMGLFVTLIAAHSSGATFALLSGYLVVLAAAAVYFGADARRKGHALTEAPTVERLGAVGAFPWFIAAGIFVFLFELWFTFFFTQNENWTAGLTDAIRYWQSQQEVNRGSQPWYYYMIVMPAYEWLGLAFAFVGFVVALRRRTFALALISWLAIASFMIYSYAGERMPWLVIHPLYPTLLLAALGVDYVWRERRGVAAKVGLGFLALGLFATAWASLRFAFVTGADSREILVQGSQATPHVTAVVERLTELDELTRQELGRPLSIGVSKDNSWPWGFYLRDFEGITWIAPPDLPELDVVIPDMTAIDGTPIVPDDHPNYVSTPISLRSWWVPRWVIVGDGENAVGGYFDGGISGWARWLYDREIWSYDGCGSHDQYYMVSQEIQALTDRAEGYGALDPLELDPIACASPMFRETS